VTRVLINDFDTIVGLGLRDVLTDRGCEVVTGRATLTPAMLADLRPDAIVVDMDDTEVTAAAEALIDEFPGIRIVECSSAQPVMRVFPAYRFGKSLDLPLDPDTLYDAVTGVCSAAAPPLTRTIPTTVKPPI
jgi:DNA-binding NarL/FixJ family response regulator